MLQGRAGGLDLPRFGFSAELPGEFRDLGDTSRPERMPFGKQTSGRVHDDLTAIGVATILDEAIENGAYRIDANFDDYYGYPSDFFIDYERNVADEERGFWIDDFIPR